MGLPHVDKARPPLSGEDVLLLRAGAVEGTAFVVDRDMHAPDQDARYHIYHLQPYEAI
jgi:hypothetical protein